MAKDNSKYLQRVDRYSKPIGADQSKEVRIPKRSAPIGQYHNLHRRNTLKKRPISIGRFEPGIIVKMDYFGKTTGRFKSAYYLIINTTYKGYIHVFDIDYVPAAALKFIINLTKNKVIEEFFFSNTSYSYYNFPSANKSLYNKLLPVFGRAYRKLIKSPKHIRKTEVVEYNFTKVRGPVNPKFVLPSIADEKLAFRGVSLSLKIGYKKMLEAAEFGKMQNLTPGLWSSIKNTDSWNTELTDTDVLAIASKNGNSIETAKRIIKGMKSNQTFYAPIIMRYNNEYYCIAGNIRLSAAMALKTIPKVYIFNFTK